MPLSRPRSSRVLRLAAVAALVGLALGCDDQPTYVPIGQVGGAGGAGGGAGSSSGAGGGGAAATTTSSASTGPGGSGGTGGEAPQAAVFAVSVDSANAAVDLRDEVEIAVSIVPNGYTGPVSLTFGVGGGSVTGALGTTKVTLDGATTATTKLTLTTLSSSPPGEVAFSVSGTVATGTKTANGSLTVSPAITVVIPKNANQLAGSGADPYKLAFGDYPIVITAPAGISNQNPVTVRFFNDDDVAHEIHGNKDANGFPHDPGPIAPNSMDELVRKVNATGSYDFYLHDQGGALTIGRIVIQ